VKAHDLLVFYYAEIFKNMFFLIGIIFGALLIAVVFGFIGIAILTKIKNAKKYINKKSLIIFCAIYAAALLLIDVSGAKSIGSSIGYLTYPWIGAVLTTGIKTKFKKIFSDQFYFAFFGTLFLSIISTIPQL
jgi:membrane-associated HD superfamily phosphohydrolase